MYHKASSKVCPWMDLVLCVNSYSPQKRADLFRHYRKCQRLQHKQFITAARNQADDMDYFIILLQEKERMETKKESQQE